MSIVFQGSTIADYIYIYVCVYRYKKFADGFLCEIHQ